MLTELLRIRKDGFDPFFAEWFFYGDDSSMEGPHELYMFFVVYIDKIHGLLWVLILLTGFIAYRLWK